MVKESMSLLWHTALSVFDVGSSIMYYLLGRDLDQNDILLIEQLFQHTTTRSMLKRELITQRFMENEYKFELDMSNKYISLIEKLKKGKDLLLVTSRSNGYNVLQATIENLLVYSSNLLRYTTNSDVESQLKYEEAIQARIRLIKAMLEYGCDPNRGLVLANKKRFVVRNDLCVIQAELPETRVIDVDKTDDDSDGSTSFKAEKKNISKPVYADSDSSDSIMATDMKNVSLNPVNAENLDILNSTPIDTPLLLVCCIYNCHNLLHLNKHSTDLELKLQRADEFSNNWRDDLIRNEIKFNRSETDDAKLRNAQKHFRRIEANQSYRSIKKKEACIGSINTNRRPCNNSSCNSSSRSSDVSSDTDDSESSECEETEFYNSNDTIQTSQTSCDLIKRRYRGLETNLIDETHCKEEYFVEKDNLIEETVISSDDEEEEKQIDYSMENIYNYDQDDMNYFDKYEYDTNSIIRKQYTTSQHHLLNQINYINNTNPVNPAKEPENPIHKISSLTSIYSNQFMEFLNWKSLPENNESSEKIFKPEQKETKSRSSYDILNKQRLELIDLLLKYDADKYLIAKLTTSSFNKLNKKSQNMLKKWYEAPLSFRHKHANSSELRPFSPLMASLCMDDVEVFSRLYKHHQILFNYFKPDEDLELIYYAIKFQSETCLIYLLSYSSSSKTLVQGLSEKSMLSTNKCFSLPNNLNTTGSMIPRSYSVQNIDDNINTMFYILENTRSAKIISVLLKCGFDLTKSEPFSGNTALHCIFNESNTVRFDGLKSYGIDSKFDFTQHTNTIKTLDEFYVPKNLTKILFTLLKHGGLKPHVNKANYEHKVCMQVLFEWTEMIETVCFINYNDYHRDEWKTEIYECVSLLLKSGADIFIPNLPDKNESVSYNCVDTLIKSILRHIDFNENQSSTFNSRSKSPLSFQATGSSPSSPSPPSNNDHYSHISSKSGFCHKKAYLQSTANLRKHLDTKFLLHLFANVLCLESIASAPKKRHEYQRSYIHKSYHNSAPKITSNIFESGVNIEEKWYNSLIGNYIKILMNSYLDDFESAFKLLKLLCKFEKQLAMSSNEKKKPAMVEPNLIKKLITQWILQPNFLSSTRQFEKNYFIKSVLVHLITSKLLNPNDCFTYQSENNVLISNNLLNHCVHLVTLCKTAYQLDLIYDLTRTLIQYGANPNLDPYELSSAHQSQMMTLPSHQIKLSQFKCVSPSFFDPMCSHSTLKRSMSILTQLCDSIHITSALTPFNLKHNDTIGERCYQNYDHNQPHLRQIYPDHSNPGTPTNPNREVNMDQSQDSHNNTIKKNNYFNNYFNERYFSIESRTTEKFNSENRCEFNMASKKSRSSSPILLLTPAPSYESLLLLAGGTYSSQSSNNIIIDSSLLLLSHYKNFIKLLYDTMESESINKCLKYKMHSHESHIHCSHYHNHHHHQHRTSHLNHRNHHHHHYHNNHHHHHHQHNSHHHHHQKRAQSDESLISSSKLYQTETLDTYLERLASTPRTLKSITRRHILNQLSEQQAKQTLGDNPLFKTEIVANQIFQLELPNKLKDYLLFIE